MEDNILLRTWVTKRDREAMGELLRRHSAVVLGSCLRVLGNQFDAEDAAQACLTEFVREAAGIKGQPGLWLQARAVSRARDLLRARNTRKKHERIAGTRKDVCADAVPLTEEISPAIDETIALLREELRVPIVLCYLEGRSQAAVATELGIDQATVSRRLKKGVACIRQELKRVGITVPLAGLFAFLSERMGATVPPAFTVDVERIIFNASCEKATSTETIPTSMSAADETGDAISANAWKAGVAGMASALLAGGVVAYGVFCGSAFVPKQFLPASSPMTIELERDGGITPERFGEADGCEQLVSDSLAIAPPDATATGELDDKRDWFAADPSFISPDRRDIVGRDRARREREAARRGEGK